MKSFIALIATAFAVTAFAAEPAKKEAPKAEAKPAASAPAAPAKAAEPAKKEEKKADAKKWILKRPLVLAIRATQDPDELENNEYESYEDYDLQVSYRRPEVVKERKFDTEDDISDHAKIRLMIARMKALEAYRKAYA